MFKKILFSFLALAMAFGGVFPVLAEDAGDDAVACTMEYAPVCGLDDVTYSNACMAEAAGVEVSYEFACETQTTEDGLYEEESDIHFVGMLIEVGSTDVPTNLVIRQNDTGEDFTVSITEDTVMGQRRDQYTNLSDWIPGDQIRVIGQKNENTGYIDASIVVNHSISNTTNLGANGWITNIDKDNNAITYQWANKEYTFNYDDDTRFVVGGINPASVDDLAVNDRIRARLLNRTGEDPLAEILVVLRRGEELFMKIRTFMPKVTLVRMDSPVVPTTIQVRIDPTPGLDADDVNNLVGAEGELVTINVTEDTNIVRKYFGKSTLDEFSIGDGMHIIGRVNDDGTIDAKVIKNESIWQTSTHGYAGVVNEVNTDESYIMVNWTPVKTLTQARLKEKLAEQNGTVTAQVTASARQATNTQAQERIKNILTKLKGQVQQVKEKVGNLVREIKQKKVTIDRIKTGNVQLKDLVERLDTKKIKVEITEDTQIVVGTNTGATINDIQNGDKVRVRGVKSATNDVITADTIVVVSSLPEIDSDLSEYLDDINEVVTEIVTEGNDEDDLVGDTTTDTEEEIDDDGNVVEDDSSDDGDTEEGDDEEGDTEEGDDEEGDTEEGDDEEGDTGDGDDEEGDTEEGDDDSTDDESDDSSDDDSSQDDGTEDEE